jgi:hypothetical protein
VRVPKAKITLQDNLRFTFHLMERLTGSPVVDYGGAQWQALMESIGVRDRLTHPRDLDAMRVTDSELVKVSEAFRFLVRLYDFHAMTGVAEVASKILDVFANAYRRGQEEASRQLGLAPELETETPAQVSPASDLADEQTEKSEKS